jgi:hypothetical protein
MYFTVDTGLAMVGIVLGLLAIAMAAPPLFQMLFGRPRLEFSVDEITTQDGKQLLIAIKNQKTKSRFLRRIGVEREIGNVLAYFDIQEQGTNKFVAKDISGLLNCPPTREMNLLMARAYPHFTVGISVIHAKDAAAWVIDARSEDLKPIAEGDYTLSAQIVCGEKVYAVKKKFKVGKVQHQTFWV